MLHQTLLALRLMLVFAMGSMVVGCSVYIGAPMAWKTRNIPKPPGASVAAISVASNIAFSGERNQSLAAIAANPELTEAEQSYLLAIVKRLRGFSGDITDVLVALAGNPAATAKTRNEISVLVPKLSLFSSDVSRVAAALSRH